MSLIAILYNLLSLIAVGVLLTRVSKNLKTNTVLVGLFILGLLSFVLVVISILISRSLWLAIQLVTWSLFLQLPLYLLGIAFLSRRTGRVLSLVSLFSAAIIMGIAADAFLIEPYNLEIRRYTLHSDKITKPMKIGILTDMQTDNPGPYEEGILRLLMQDAPDIILLPGDYVQHADPVEFQKLETRLNAMLKEVGVSAPLGVYAVEGDQEIKHHDLWTQSFAETKIKTFSDTISFDVGEITLTALSFDDSSDIDSSIRSALKYHIVFGHRPDYSLGKVSADLLIAGHTHGGQVQLPWLGPLVTASNVPRSWADGLTQLDPYRTLIVSRGTGMERDDAPRLRFLCRPELTLIELLPAP
ncbi:hypothetical protein HY229_02470 [Candidatus Acetothermia bacterium]|nr:hypothetical protein [Candidatus Acetothermia bacterium]MBI3642946.1 hypothetical protein [Candidatus Acetothermia bacterium]